MKSKTKPAIIKRDAKNYKMEIKFYLTLGESLALKNALFNYKSPCAQDVYAYLCNAEFEANVEIDPCKDFQWV